MPKGYFLNEGDRAVLAAAKAMTEDGGRAVRSHPGKRPRRRKAGVPVEGGASVEQGPAIITESMSGATYDDGTKTFTWGEARGYFVNASTGVVEASTGGAPSLVASDSDILEGTNLSLDWPAGSTEGRMAILYHVAWDDGLASTPTGFTLLESITGESEEPVRIDVYRQELTEDMAGSIAVTGANSVKRLAILQIWSGVKDIGEHDANQYLNDGNVPADCPGYDTVEPNSVGLRIAGAHETDSSATWNDTGAGDLDHDLSTGSGANAIGVAVTSEVHSSAGTVAAESWDHPDNPIGAAVSVVLEAEDRQIFKNVYRDAVPLEDGTAMEGWYIKEGANYFFFPGCPPGFAFTNTSGV